MSPPTLRAELARAVRVVNLAFDELSEDEQLRVHLVGDRPVDLALAGGDRAKGLAQIEGWRDRQLAAIAEAIR